MWSLPISTFLFLLVTDSTSATFQRQKRQGKTSTVDYVIVGGGTAGAALAARLSEDSGVTVAVIEAGGDSVDDNPISQVPGLDVLGTGASPASTLPFDWNFITTAQTGAGNRQIHYARGKGIGGSSQRNFMVYQRPTSDSFDLWVNATAGQDSPGWSWKDVYPYFTKSVSITPADNALRGANKAPKFNAAAFPEKNASLPLAYANFAFDYSITLKSAFNELGYPEATDFSSGTLNGAQYNPSTIDHSNGHRASSQYFLDAAKSRSNLKTITNALAKKINFDSNKRAVSVTYTTLLGVVKNTITARKEIILCAGAFQSPQLLMVSGVGPKVQLDKFKIPVVVDLPGVGQNLQDQIFFSPTYEIKPDIFQFGHMATLISAIDSGLNFFTNNSGAFTNPVADYINFQKLNSTFFSAHPEAAALQSYPELWPHIEYIAAAGFIADYQDPFMQNFLPANLENRFFYSLLGALVAPLSRGTVTLASADTKDLPVIDPKWLTSPGDQAVAVETFKKIRRIFNTAAFKSVRINDEEAFPGYNVSSDADILSAIQNSLMTVWHASCTCAMQPRESNGVLDPYLRVYGTTGLRVVDASSFPMLPPGHPQSVVYMLAERAADLIKVARGAKITTTPRTPPSGDAGSPYDGPN